MTPDSFEKFVSQSAEMLTGEVVACTSPRLLDGIEFIDIYLFQTEDPQAMRTVNLDLSLEDYEGRFAGSSILFTRQGR